MASSRLSGPGTLFLDAHVHLYPRFDASRFFDAAAANLRADADGAWAGCLVMTEAAGYHQFHRLRTGELIAEGWGFTPTDESHSLEVVGKGLGGRLWLIEGRQIETSEGLEILAFPLSDTIPDGTPAEATLALVDEAGALSMIPWGFGKWWLDRGRHLDRLLRDAKHRFLLADNGHRPSFGLRPAAFPTAEDRSIPILAGSDPLPLPGEETRAGSFGSRLSVDLRPATPAASLADHLRSLTASPPTFGARTPPSRFVWTQAAMQARKRGWIR